MKSQSESLRMQTQCSEYFLGGHTIFDKKKKTQYRCRQFARLLQRHFTLLPQNPSEWKKILALRTNTIISLRLYKRKKNNTKPLHKLAILQRSITRKGLIGKVGVRHLSPDFCLLAHETKQTVENWHLDTNRSMSGRKDIWHPKRLSNFIFLPIFNSWEPTGQDSESNTSKDLGHKWPNSTTEDL